jgi:hypothetical protein
VSRDFLLQVLLWIISPQASKKVFGLFRIFAAGVNYTGGKFATGINDNGPKFCHRYHWCCWILVANNGNNISLQLKVSLKDKIIYMLILQPIGVQKYTFLIENLSNLPPGSTTLVVHLELQYLSRVPAQLTPAAMWLYTEKRKTKKKKPKMSQIRIH